MAYTYTDYEEEDYVSIDDMVSPAQQQAYVKEAELQNENKRTWDSVFGDIVDVTNFGLNTWGRVDGILNGTAGGNTAGGNTAGGNNNGGNTNYTPPTPEKNNTMLFIGIGAVVVIGGILILMPKNDVGKS